MKYYYELMQKEGAAPDHRTYVPILGLYIKQKRTKQVMHYFDELLSKNVKPDVLLFEQVLEACNQGKEYDKLRKYAELMASFNLLPSQYVSIQHSNLMYPPRFITQLLSKLPT